jgi:aspartate carbamoyltransferase catalytic subunit
MIPESLLTIREISAERIQAFLILSERMKQAPENFSHLLKSRTVLQFFVENSTRTRMSFEAATRKLGGTNIAFTVGTSSLAKGETLLDTVQTIRRYGVDSVVMRNYSGGSPKLLADVLQLPIVNAGDGQHEHPTQALLDSLTLAQHWAVDWSKINAMPFKNKKVMIIGDILHSRVARSNIHCLTKLGAEVILCAPRTLLPSDFSLFPKVQIETRPDHALKEIDAVMCLRIQVERQNQQQIPSKEEYRHFWGLTVERAKTLRKEAVILHPAPMNRGIEIDSEVADSAQSLILKQVENGVWARMAVLGSLLNPEGVAGVKNEAVKS